MLYQLSYASGWVGFSEEKVVEFCHTLRQLRTAYDRLFKDITGCGYSMTSCGFV
jgi:hypothetical protein